MWAWFAEADPLSLTWQGYLVLNLAGVGGVIFFLGKLVQKVNQHDEDAKLLREKTEDIRGELATRTELLRDRMMERMDLVERGRIDDRHKLRDEIHAMLFNSMSALEERIRELKEDNNAHHEQLREDISKIRDKE